MKNLIKLFLLIMSMFFSDLLCVTRRLSVSSKDIALDALMENTRYYTTLECRFEPDSDYSDLINALKTNNTFRIIDFSMNCLTDEIINLADVLKENNTIEELILSGCEIDTDGFIALMDCLKENTTLKRLDLSNNLIGFNNSDNQNLSIAGSLEELNLRKNCLEDKWAIMFATMIQNNQDLKKVNLSNNNITDKGAKKLYKILENNKTIKINLHNNGINTSILEEIKNLDVNPSPNIGKEIFAYSVGSCINVLESGDYHIKSLKLCHQPIDDEYIDQIVEQLKKNTILKKICLRDDSINDTQFKKIVSGLANNRVLKKLDFAQNNIEDSGVEAFAKILKKNKHLKEVNFSLNRIRETGIKALCKALKKNKKLKSLNLSINYIGDNVTDDLVDLLKTNTSLEYLNISVNDFGYQAIGKLFEALKKNKTLKEFDIRNNKITVENIFELIEILKSGSVFKKIDTHFYTIKQLKYADINLMFPDGNQKLLKL